ncbi:MAG: hypothetical protein WCF98_12380, partial [Synechococcus sp. ELA057]
MRPRLLQLPLAALILAGAGAARAQPEPQGEVRWQPVNEQAPANRNQALPAPAFSRPQWQPLPGSAAAPGAGAGSAGAPSVVWSPVPTASTTASTPARSTGPTPPSGGGGSGPAVVWRPLTPEETKAIAAITTSNPPGTASRSGGSKPPLQPPTSPQQAEALSQSLAPVAADYTPQLRLGPAVPTANQLGAQQGQVSAYQLAPLAGGGAAGGSGNQDYVFN